MELDLSKYMTQLGENESSTSKYRLFGAVVHTSQTLKHGHYYALAKNPSNRWTRYNDSNCTNLHSDDVLKETKAFILFYSSNTSKDFFRCDIERAIHCKKLNQMKCANCGSTDHLAACARCVARLLCDKCKRNSICCKICRKFFNHVPMLKF